jgi:hypothetical protein
MVPLFVRQPGLVRLGTAVAVVLLCAPPVPSILSAQQPRATHEVDTLAGGVKRVRNFAPAPGDRPAWRIADEAEHASSVAKQASSMPKEASLAMAAARRTPGTA